MHMQNDEITVREHADALIVGLCEVFYDAIEVFPQPRAIVLDQRVVLFVRVAEKAVSGVGISLVKGLLVEGLNEGLVGFKQVVHGRFPFSQPKKASAMGTSDRQVSNRAILSSRKANMATTRSSSTRPFLEAVLCRIIAALLRP
jgi:hypothetical protein